MLLSRESDYALRIVRKLADGNQHKAQSISEQEQIPKQYIYKILKKLEQHQFIRILQGANGGCVLTADLSQTTLLDIMVAVGDTPIVNACTKEGYACQYAQTSGNCSYHCGLMALQKRMETELQSITLASLLKTKHNDTQV